MPKFFFDVQDGEGTFIDEVGVDLPNVDAAIKEARRALADMVQDALRDRTRENLSILIRDGAEGPIMMCVTLRTVSPAHGHRGRYRPGRRQDSDDERL